MIQLRTRTCLGLVLVGIVSITACGGSSSSSSPSPVPAPAPSPTPAPTPAPAPAPAFSAVDLREGTGATAFTGRNVAVSYTGWLYDPSRPDSKGTQFDSGNISFLLGARKVIPGWDQGIVNMKVGGQRRLVIPPNLGYGSQPVGTIPANSTLVFDVTLNGVL